MGTLQLLLKHVYHGLVRGFRLPVRLGVAGCGEGKLFAPVLAEFLEVVARDPEASDYVGSQEFADLKVRYSAECFCFDPFGEVVSDYQKEDLLPRRYREFPHYVHAPFSEGPW